MGGANAIWGLCRYNLKVLKLPKPDFWRFWLSLVPLVNRVKKEPIRGNRFREKFGAFVKGPDVGQNHHLLSRGRGKQGKKWKEEDRRFGDSWI